MKLITSYKLILFIQVISLIIFAFSIFNLNIFPTIYTIIMLLVLMLINILLFFGNKKNNIVTKVISVILSVFLCFLVIYITKSVNFLKNITEVSGEINQISLIVKKDSVYQIVDDLDNKEVQINTTYNAIAMGATMNQINEWISCNYSSEDNFIKMATNLYNGDVDAILVNEAYLWVMEHKYENFREDTRIIWTYEYKKEKEDIKKPVVVNNECFNVLISGIDTKGPVSTVSRSDVNMIATVNTTNHQILLTSIPRDYYVYISKLKEKDKLTHAGLLGINSSISTLEDLLDIDINYYVKVNFTSLIRMVDVLGGIEVELPYSIFSHKKEKYFEKGINYLDGEKALMLSRERYYLTDGDNERIKNQQRVIQGMLDKLTSPTVITNYMDILDSVAGSFETNMSMKEITSLLKEQLKTMKSWDIQSYSLTGNGSYFKGGAMMPDTELYYCIPDEKSVKKATDYINSMIDGEYIIVE